ncbi:hypothetical protein L861_06445 [Litchfieldella anticariensis FP35 = DSM 16096]|uniref:DUF3577 domain-containing protein n=1 Tax=Litchfieldella anticariensis (strain DSM 16096 / CECT 5854 / CIP 108499 / LMG 22089 / FP35) TaxID=1121939 RepID=S2KJK7_LITA3|nr:STY4534 family ICE replication protein [Halomonas anticariensis]EPC00573.1 hypothetical protein L861_06445 [Halomonas anticariensis FP35 = DSM 16096]
MTTSTQAKQNGNPFFDLHITGLGYLNRVREVTPKRGNPFWACDIAALSGPADDVEYRRFDCRVSGHDAIKLVKRCQEAVDQDRKVLIGFRLGDPWIDTFTYEKGEKQGQLGISLKARLLFISWIKIDGEGVYQAPRRGEASQESPNDSEVPEEHSASTSVSSERGSPAGEAAGSFDSPAGIA